LFLTRGARIATPRMRAPASRHRLGQWAPFGGPLRSAPRRGANRCCWDSNKKCGDSHQNESLGTSTRVGPWNKPPRGRPTRGDEGPMVVALSCSEGAAVKRQQGPPEWAPARGGGVARGSRALGTRACYDPTQLKDAYIYLSRLKQ